MIFIHLWRKPKLNGYKQITFDKKLWLINVKIDQNKDYKNYMTYNDNILNLTETFFGTKKKKYI